MSEKKYQGPLISFVPKGHHGRRPQKTAEDWAVITYRHAVLHILPLAVVVLFMLWADPLPPVAWIGKLLIGYFTLMAVWFIIVCKVNSYISLFIYQPARSGSPTA